MAIDQSSTSHVNAIAVVQAAPNIATAEQIFLTPYLALVCSQFYVMAAGDKLSAHHVTQVQVSLNGDSSVIQYALQYVRSTPIEKFLTAANDVLSAKDKWCILANVCDATLAKDDATSNEKKIFLQLATAFDIDELSFRPYLKILKLKRNPKILGDYSGIDASGQTITTHFALAVSLLYMATANGSLKAHEIAQIKEQIEEFKGLQNAAIAYVRSNKVSQFLIDASKALKPGLKIYILANVCDVMMSTGEVGNLQDKLFFSMLSAFGMTDEMFAPYWQVLETKNFKPFDTRKFVNLVVHERQSGEIKNEGLIFKNAWNDENVSDKNRNSSELNDKNWSSHLANQNNLQFSNHSSENIQQLAGSAHQENLQRIDIDPAHNNHQLITLDTRSGNQQTLAHDENGANRQLLTAEVRSQNIFQFIETVNMQLNQFEKVNANFLEMGRVHAANETANETLSLAPTSIPVAEPEPEPEPKPPKLKPNDQSIQRPQAHASKSRRSGFVYVQLAIAASAIGFAVPIQTKGFFGTSSFGQLIKRPATETTEPAAESGISAQSVDAVPLRVFQRKQ